METANLFPQARAAIKAAVPSALLPLTLVRSLVRGEAEASGFSASEFPGRVISDVDPNRIVLKLDVLSVLVPEAGAVDLVAKLQTDLQRHNCQALLTATDTKEFSYIFGEGVMKAKSGYDKPIAGMYTSNEMGLWRETPSGFRPAVLPHIAKCTPFVMTSCDQFRAPPPPAVDSKQAAERPRCVALRSSRACAWCLLPRQTGARACSAGSRS